MLDRMFTNMRSFFLANAGATRGGSTLELPGVTAAFVPAMPERSVVNCVVYDEADALAAAYDQLAAAYDDAGVNAWTVWVHESDADAAALLRDAGHLLDAEPMAQARELEGVERPSDGELDLLADAGPEDFDPVIASAYGWPGFARPYERWPEGFHAYVAAEDGRPVCCLGIWDDGGDAGVQLVGTIPEARGRGLASRLLARALAEARDRGCTTTSLVATRAGHPVYTRLGYEDLGRVQMWERRKPSPAG